VNPCAYSSLIIWKSSSFNKAQKVREFIYNAGVVILLVCSRLSLGKGPWPAVLLSAAQHGTQHESESEVEEADHLFSEKHNLLLFRSENVLDTLVVILQNCNLKGYFLRVEN
jgi:hypothetical protein